MKNRKQLHRLIHKLSKGEKRAFKLYIKKYKTQDQKVKLLFDALNKMPKYDESKLLSLFPKGRLNYNLHRLRGLLLSALSDIHFKNDPESQGETINRIQLGLKYEDKSLVEESLQKGYEIAKKSDNITLMLYLLQCEQDYVLTQQDLARVIEVEKQINELTARLNTETLYNVLWREVLHWTKANRKKDKCDPLKFSDKRLRHLFNAPQDKNASFHQQKRQLQIKKAYIDITDRANVDLRLEQDIKIFELYKNHGKEITPLMVHNIALNYLRANRPKAAKNKIKQSGLFEKLSSGYIFNPTGEEILMMRTLFLYFFYVDDYDSMLKMTPRIQEFLEEDGSDIGQMQLLNYEQLTFLPIVALFKRQKYDICLTWIFKIKELDKNQTKAKSLASTVFQFIELFSHLELGNLKLIPSLLKKIQYAVDLKEAFTMTEERELIRVTKAIIKKKEFTLKEKIFDLEGPFTYYRIFKEYFDNTQKTWKA